MFLFSHLKDLFYGKNVLFGASRSPAWPQVRLLHLVKHPVCEVCGGKKRVQVHHIKPFHLHPDLELDPTNLVTLCEGWAVANCHLLFGHLGDFRDDNPTVLKDARHWGRKINNRKELWT